MRPRPTLTPFGPHSITQRGVRHEAARLPEYKDALELAVSEALSGQAGAQEALDEAAETWNEITDRLGRDEQLRIYREALGLTG